MPPLTDIIRTRRHARGMRLLDLAARVGKSRSTVHRWERGESVPSMRDLRRLAKVLQFSVAEAMA